MTVRTFTAVEYAVVLGYLLLVALVGASFYRRRATASEYFLGGRRMGWLPVGISIMAADLSAITLMGVPGWTFGKNLEIAWSFLGPLLAAPVVIRVFIPFYCGLRLYTAYEYLERRFNLWVRLTGSLLFQMLRAAHVAIAIYGPSIALSVATGLPVWQCVLLMGIITTAYTSFGGVKAVIWTDVIQSVTIWASIGVMLTAAVVQIRGGIGEAVATAAAAGRLRHVNLSFDPAETTSLWACLLGGGMLSLAALATDQALLQRLFTTRSKRDAVQSVLANGLLQLPILVLLGLLGPVLFAYYRGRERELAALPLHDAIVPYFAVQQLPPLLSGLVVAAIFAASMAVMSAGINSLSTATTVDFYERLWSGAGSVRFGRIATVAWGIASTVLALLMGRLGELAVAYNKVSGFLSGPVLGIFLLGMATRRANAAGVLIGAAAGTALVAAVAAWTPVSFFYYSVIGVAATVSTGWAASLLAAPPHARQLHGLVLGDAPSANRSPAVAARKRRSIPSRDREGAGAQSEGGASVKGES